MICLVTAALCCGTALATRRSLDDLDKAVAGLAQCVDDLDDANAASLARYYRDRPREP